MGLSLIQSLMGQSHLLCEAHLLDTGLSLTGVLWVSLISCTMLICSRQASLWVSLICCARSFVGDNSFSGLESLTLIALSCNPKLSLVGQQTAKHDGLYPLLSVSLTVASLCWVLSAARRSLLRWFLCLSLSLLSSDSISESYIQLARSSHVLGV